MTRLAFSHRPLIMGIVNVTPDSFSGDGLLSNTDYMAAVIQQAQHMLADGADILDIGGESTRPGATPVDAAEEIRRVVPVIEAIRLFSSKILLSVDTFKPEVASASLDAGADIVNDITALSYAPAMAEIVARHKCPIILMHNRSKAASVTRDVRLGGEYGAGDYESIIDDVKHDLMLSVKSARQAGIADENIILDPGIGFGKNVAQNLALIKHVNSFHELGFPVLLGPSRKSFIGKTLDLPIGERLEGTAAAVAIGAFLGADIVRVHDVKFMSRAAKMASAIRVA